MAATVDVERPVDIGELDLRPCEHQAGGHFASEQGASMQIASIQRETAMSSIAACFHRQGGWYVRG